MDKKDNKKTTNKKEKKKIVPFEQIDITTATEDEIIKSGIKYKTKVDYTCYLLMFAVFVLAILPVALRIIIPRPITQIERDVVYFSLTCYKTTGRDNYELSTTINADYRDGAVNTFVFDFKYYKRNDQAKDGYVFAEVEEFEKLKLDGITTKKDEGSTVFTIDFENHPELKDNEVLNEYSYFSTAEINLLQNEKGFSCITSSETKRELVYVDTGKKVE